MSDLIRRQDVYDILKKVNICEMPVYVFDKLWNRIRDIPSADPEHITGNTVHLCKSCKYTYPECPNDGKVIFGDGKGNDNICACSEYEPKSLERKKGKWIPVDSKTVNGRCSICGYESHLYENDVYGENYCPNCGAEMTRGEL